MTQAELPFTLNWAKAIEAVALLASKQPGIDVYRVAKVLFYAEKKHINRYGRPITGDTYKALAHGPVPSGIHDLIDKDSFVDPDYQEMLGQCVEVVKEPYSKLRPKRAPNLDSFSETDLEC